MDTALDAHGAETYRLSSAGRGGRGRVALDSPGWQTFDFAKATSMQNGPLLFMVSWSKVIVSL